MNWESYALEGKVHKGLWALIIFFLLFSSTTFSQRIVPFDPVTGDSIPTNTPLPAYVQFRVLDLDPPTANEESANFPEWTYYWRFGDCGSPSLRREPKHGYDPVPGNSYQVSLVLTGIYSDDDDIEEIFYPSDSTYFTVLATADAPQLQSELAPRPGRNVSILPVREPSPGKLVTYLLPFRSNQNSNAVNASVQVDFPTSILTPDLSLLDNCGYTAPPQLLSGVTSSLLFNHNQLGSLDEPCLRISFWTNSEAETGTRVSIIAHYLDNLGGQSSDTLYAYVVDSQDPNEKLVREKNVCPGNNLYYTIQFENYGNGPAENVTIIDRLDSVLDMNSLTVEGHALGNAPLTVRYDLALDSNFSPNAVVPSVLPTTDPQVTLIIDTNLLLTAWIFHHIQLAPYGSPGNAGEVSYSIKVKDDAPEDWTSFGKHASIYFDDNEEIPTSAVQSVLRPCYCKPAANNGTHYIDEVGIGGKTNPSLHEEGYSFFYQRDYILKKGKTNTFHTSFFKPEQDKSRVFWRVWLDANRDGDFTENEKLLQYEGTNLHQSINLPQGTATGLAILRVAAQTKAFPEPCLLTFPGEIEDYQVLVESDNKGDLKPLTPQFELPVLVPGQSNVVVGRYVNRGPAAVPANKINYYLSTDAFLSPDDHLLASHLTQALGHGQPQEDSSNLFIPAGLSGPHFLLTVLDPDENLSENREENNLLATGMLVSPLKPDLLLTTGLTCQTALRQNTSLRVSYRVTNVGPGDVQAGSGGLMGVYLSALPFWDNSAVLADHIPIPDLSSGASAHHTFTMNFASYPTFPAGNYYVILRADYNQAVDEVLESNNETSMPIETKTDGYNSLPYSIGFECGGLDAGWGVDPFGFHSVWYDPLIAYQGNRILTVGSPWGFTGTGQVDLGLDLQGANQVELDFYWLSVGSVSKPQDGIYLSVDQGNSFQKIYTFSQSQASIPGWHHFNQRLDSLAFQQNISLLDSIILRWQYHDTTGSITDGIGLDELRVLPVPTSGNPRMLVDAGTDLSLKAYPNPFREGFTIECHKPEKSQPLQIRCFDMRGNELHPIINQSHQGEELKMEVLPEGWVSGIYFCRVTIGDKTQTLKLIKLD